MFFNGLQFKLIEKSIGLTEFCGFTRCENNNAKDGEVFARKTAFCGAQSFCGTIEGKSLKYLSYAQSGNSLEVVQANNLISVSTGVKADKSGALKIRNVINNVYGYPVTIGDVTLFSAGGFNLNGSYICGESSLSLLKNKNFALKNLLSENKNVTPEILNERLKTLGLPSDDKWVFFDENLKLYLAFCYEDLGDGWQFYVDGGNLCFYSSGETNGDKKEQIILNANGGEYVSRTFIVAAASAATEAVQSLKAVLI